MAKNQINQLSKRQILESLMYEQNQSNATLSRLITAVARTAGVDPEKLADMFVDDKANQEYVEKFNLAVKAKHAEKHANGEDHGDHAGHDHASENVAETKENSESTSDAQSNSEDEQAV